MRRTEFVVPGMDCATEEVSIRQRLAALRGIESIGIDLAERRLTVEHTLPDDSSIIRELKAIGLKAQRADELSAATLARQARLRSIAFAAGGVLALGSEGVSLAGFGEQHALVVVMAILAIGLCGLPTLRKGWAALRTLTLNISFLMSIAVVGAMCIGEWPEAAMVVFLFSLAEWIEARSLSHARNAVRELLALAPEDATVLQEDGSWIKKRAEEVLTGAVVRIKPGERVPLDGIVVFGASAVDQAPITGESVPVEKGIGATVFAGTINAEGVLDVRTTGGKDQTTIAKIVRTVQEAQGQRAPAQRFVDAFARVYTPIICVVAVLVATLPWAVFGEPFLSWLHRALVLLVIACPCALVISTPVTIVSGLAAAARRGILIKGGMHLESGRKLRAVALDKTGTITTGHPRLTDVIPLRGKDRDRVLQLAASLDALSDHPVARAVAAGWSGARLPVERFASLPGRGVAGVVAGERMLLGNHRLAEDTGICGAEVEQALQALEARGKTAIVLMTEREALGVLAVADTVRPTSVDAIRELHAMGLRTTMLTGDNARTAASIASQVDVEDVRGDLLPADKVAAIDQLLVRYGYVGMVGDGVNDAPALAKATIGFAMGKGGTDVAIDTADVAFMRDDLRGLVEFLRLSSRTHAVLLQNITLALSMKAAFFALAFAGVANLWMAVIADMGASLAVILNGLRLLRQAPRQE
ncbi:MAG: heavy metal translocating P-type ATPase [Planctomycetes bacterium]|nr:heavy metal translocating P-type ATPase [Planctomycetota bacterium]